MATTYTRIDTEARAVELAEHLNGKARARPTAVITIAAGQSTPYIDVEQIADDLHGLTDVYLIATGPHTWIFSQHMSEGTQVYGGAGRVYPPGNAWVHDLSKSPLRFAWGRNEGPRATQRLIDDGLDMAAAAGLLGKRAVPSTKQVHRVGVVRRVQNERAWVEFGGGGLDIALVPPQLAEPELPIERALQEGMQVRGVLDPESKWFDIRESRLSPADALSRYEIGEVVLAEVTDVDEESATARLLPAVTVKLSRSDVTPDDSDLRTLLTQGEIVPARVLSTSPWWLTLLDVDEEPVPAAGIYPGGPPWLLPPTEVETECEDLAPPTLVSPAPFTVVETQEAAPPKIVEATFSPAHMPASLGGRPRPVQPANDASTTSPAPAGTAVRDLSLKVDELRARTSTLESQLEALQDELKGLRCERQQLEALKNTAERRANRLETELKKSRSALRKASAAHPLWSPEFADPERRFRYLVETAWARRIPVAEQPERDLPDYVIGPAFMDSVATLQGITIEKVADVVMELLTGIAESSPGRGMHHLREGTGGEDAVVRRGDGAICWRLALQINTPSARRLHAWRLPHGRWELASVRKHDDFNP